MHASSDISSVSSRAAKRAARAFRHPALTITLAAALLASGCQSSGRSTPAPQAGFAADADTADERAALVADKAAVHVRGLSCPLCAHNIDHQLKRLAGVRDVQVDLGQGIVTVLLGEPYPSRRDLTKAIDESGFTVDRIEVAQP